MVSLCAQIAVAQETNSTVVPEVEPVAAIAPAVPPAGEPQGVDGNDPRFIMGVWIPLGSIALFLMGVLITSQIMQCRNAGNAGAIRGQKPVWNPPAPRTVELPARRMPVATPEPGEDV